VLPGNLYCRLRVCLDLCKVYEWGKATYISNVWSTKTMLDDLRHNWPNWKLEYFGSSSGYGRVSSCCTPPFVPLCCAALLVSCTTFLLSEYWITVFFYVRISAYLVTSIVLVDSSIRINWSLELVVSSVFPYVFSLFRHTSFTTRSFAHWRARPAEGLGDFQIPPVLSSDVSDANRNCEILSYLVQPTSLTRSI